LAGLRRIGSLPGTAGERSAPDGEPAVPESTPEGWGRRWAKALPCSRWEVTW